MKEQIVDKENHGPEAIGFFASAKITVVRGRASPGRDQAWVSSGGRGS